MKYKSSKLIALILISLGLCSCGIVFNNTGNLDGSSAGVCPAITDSTLTVGELYPTFTRWNDYVQRVSTVTACGGADRGVGGNNNCIHAGERRKVTLPSVCRFLFWNFSGG